MKRKLLFLMGDYAQKRKNAVAATLAWAAEADGRLFETYYDVYRTGRHYCGEPFRFKDGKVPWGDYFGSTVVGGMQHEQFYLINAYFDVEYVLLDTPCLFESSVRALGAPVVSEADDYPALYRKVFEHLHLAIPDTAVMVSAEPSGEMIFGFDSLCYPDIYYGRALGLDTSATDSELAALKEMGVKTIRCLYIGEARERELESLGFEVVSVDRLAPGERYATLTRRICGRWIESARQVSLSDPALASFWMPWMCRHQCVPMFDFDVGEVIPDIVDLAHAKGQRVVWGRQNSDQDILKLSKAGLSIQIIDPNRPPFSIMEQVNMPWVHAANSYADPEPSDDELRRYAKEGKVLATLLFHAGDVRHSDIIPRIFDFVAMHKLKIGIGITADWYRFYPEMMELTRIPLERGGLFPYIEPLMYTGALGIAAEGNGYLDLDVLRRNLEEARGIISRHASACAQPQGYYTFLDIQLRDYTKGRPELYEMIADMGFEYMVSSMNPGECALQYRKDRFVSLNMSPPYFGFYSNFVRANDLNEIDLCEDRCVEMKRPGWIIAALDSPIWGFEYAPWESGAELKRIAAYMTSTGNTGKLVNATPHTIARYARILADMGTVPTNRKY